MAVRRARRSAKNKGNQQPAPEPTPVPAPPAGEAEREAVVDDIVDTACEMLSQGSRAGQSAQMPSDAIALSTVRLFSADHDGQDGRRWDGARKWCTAAGMLYVATDGGLRVYGPGSWWGVAE